MNILFHLQQIEEIIKEGAENPPDDIILMILQTASHLEGIKDSFDLIDKNTEMLQEQFKKAVDAHFLKDVLKAIGVDLDISYKNVDGNFDMIIERTIDDKDIKINISSAIRMYTEGLSILESKQTALNEMKFQYEQKYIAGYENRRERLMKKIRGMEDSPHLYSDLMDNFPNYSRVFHYITKVDVHEEIPYELPEDIANTYENIFEYIEGVISKERQLVVKIKESIESLFEEDERIAEAIFDGEG